MKKIIFFAAIAIGVMIIFSLIGSIYQLWHKQDVLYTTAKRLVQVKKEQQALTQQLHVVGTDQFVEQQARNDLFLTKPGEHEVIISGNLPEQKMKTKEKQKNMPNWQQWVNLFF